MTTSDEVLEFWFSVLSREDHFMGGERVDEMVASRFGALWESAAGGGCAGWEETAEGTLALVIVLDQFPRNMFRGSGRSFHSDALAREIAVRTLETGRDMEFEESRRMFLYMPFMHSERLEDQNRCCELTETRLGDSGASTLLHARAHRRVIEMFGRFPYRNEALGRESTSEETAWLADVGYAGLVKQMEAE